jgi:hypothetical protein
MNPSDELLDAEEPPSLFTTVSDIYAFSMTVIEVRAQAAYEIGSIINSS